LATLRDSLAGNGRIDTITNAIGFAEIILMAIPYDAVAAVASAHAAALAGKIIIDATNKFGAPVVNNLKTIQQAAPTAVLFRAFNALGWEIFANPQIDGIQVDHFYCGPDGEQRPFVDQLIAAVGVRPIWVGGLEAAPLIDGLGSLWAALAIRQGRGRGIAFKLLERTS
jgi:hypothetical protein